MKTVLLLFLMGLLTQPVCAREPKFVAKPEVMSVTIGGHFGDSFKITYDRRELRYYFAKEGADLERVRAVLVKPTDDQWQTFFDELERMQVWKWKRYYEDPDEQDGTFWNAYVIYDLRSPRDLVSSGSNAYPPDFKRFLALVRKLMGGRKFE